MSNAAQPSNTDRDAAVENAAGPPTARDAPRQPSFRGRWAQVLTSTLTPRQWALVAEGIRTADAARHDEFGEPIVRGGEAWCRVAVTALETTALETPSDAAKGLPDALPARCFIDPELLSAWLHAPAPDSYHDTVSDTLYLVDWGLASDPATHQAMTNLLSKAQEAGVFGVAGYRIDLHRLVETDDRHAGYLLVVRPVFGPSLASFPLPDEELFRENAASPAEGAVLVLAGIAGAVDATLDSAQRNPSTPRPGYGRAHRGHAPAAPKTVASNELGSPPTEPPERPRRARAR
jgi:hypothetical protein